MGPQFDLGRRALMYTWPDMFHAQPGLGHMKEIARTLALEATKCHRVGYLPPLRRSHHNREAPRVLRWSDYFEWSDLPLHDSSWAGRRALARTLRQFSTVHVLDGAEVPDATDVDADLVVRCFGGPSIFGEWLQPREWGEPSALDEPAFSERYPTAIVHHAESVVAEIGEPSGVLHIRRSDAASEATAPAAVIAHLHDKGCTHADRIFVLTDERRPDYHDALRREFPGIVYEQEVTYLRQLRRSSRDNYIVFRVCKCVQTLHDRRTLGTMRHIPPPTSRNPQSPGRTLLATIVRRWSDLLAVTPQWVRANVPVSAST